ncbi:UPF0481 protein At3g47200-like [Lycium barbarum]|uniref:UPF0481 protein At3g47200-like n=1 Tax=Lycium barbarum TaxID=112863 RepID=UPI00293E62C7|nr:UPF0481 protein At3g47200-like [Lycium barbarum]
MEYSAIFVKDYTLVDDQSPLLHQATKDEVGKAMKRDHLIEINETNDQDQLGLHANTKPCTIFKVNVGLRKSNPDAYTPMLISIGPYHYKNPELGSMEKYKLLYRRRFLQRKAGLDEESCISEIEKMKYEVLNCYDNIEDLDIDIISKFSEIIFLDGCFVVEFIREYRGMIPEGEDRIINNNYMINLACRDLLLLENQLPFFVLTKLHYMTKEVDEMPFAKLVKDTFSKLPEMDPASYFAYYLESHAENITHLLEVVHMNPHPSYWYPHPFKKCGNKNTQTWQANMPNATELCEAGVRFSKVGNIYSDLGDSTTLFDIKFKNGHMKIPCFEVDDYTEIPFSYSDLGDSTALFDIKFENGQMKIPCFEVNDYTETLFRNLVAYEQQSCDVHPKCFSDFAAFMDYLIDSDKDVSLLRRKGIISNQLGEDNEVANIFNKIGQGIIFSTDFYYKDLCRAAIQHSEKPWNRIMANLRSNYFHSPWAGASTVAAIILLLLTATQTVLSFISLFK